MSLHAEQPEHAPGFSKVIVEEVITTVIQEGASQKQPVLEHVKVEIRMEETVILEGIKNMDGPPVEVVEETVKSDAVDKPIDGTAEKPVDGVVDATQKHVDGTDGTHAHSELYQAARDNTPPVVTDTVVSDPSNIRLPPSNPASPTSGFLTPRDRSSTEPVRAGDIGNVPRLDHSVSATRGEFDTFRDDQVRASGKSKRKERKLMKRSTRIKIVHKKNLLGETIYKGHPSWILMQDIQTGIRNGVGKNMGASIAFPGPNDFLHSSEFFNSPSVLRFPTEGSSHTIPHATGPFKFKDYCPHAFRCLRQHFGIDPADYMVSLCNTQKDGENALRELPTPGKSGSLFLFSSDMQFILKTVPKREAKLLRYILPSYFEHVLANENTLLPRFFGLHRVKPHKGRQVRFVVMGNVFPTTRKIHERFDLKGSVVGRAALPQELLSETVTLKDLDFRERRKGGITLGSQRRATLLAQLERDCKLLERLGIMDYSLLVGIHYENRKDDPYPSPEMGRTESLSDTEDAEADGPMSPVMNASFNNNEPSGLEQKMSIFQQNDGGMQGLDEAGNNIGERYYIGIIDILMLYSARKQLEHTFKSIRYKADQISSVSPGEYSARFQAFIKSIVV